MTNAIAVSFHGSELYIVNHNGEPFTPMKPIVEGMGMDWKSQFIKLKQRFKTCVVEITMQLPGDNQRRSVICLALRKLAAWLNTISPNEFPAQAGMNRTYPMFLAARFRVPRPGGDEPVLGFVCACECACIVDIKKPLSESGASFDNVL